MIRWYKNKAKIQIKKDEQQKNRSQQKHNKMGKKSRSNLFACIYRISLETS